MNAKKPGIIVAYWLLKTEPSTYSFTDLERDHSAVWDGISNPLALRHLRSMAAGDLALVYHTGNEKQIVGIARVSSGPYPDPKQKDHRLVVVDLKPERRLPKPVTLAAVKEKREFADFLLVRMPRLSVMPVTPAQWKALTAMSR